MDIKRTESERQPEGRTNRERHIRTDTQKGNQSEKQKNDTGSRYE